MINKKEFSKESRGTKVELKIPYTLINMLKTLIIEDERHVRENLKKRVFQDFQNELSIIDEAISVKEGIEKIKRYQPQLVFMDMILETELVLIFYLL